MEHCHGKHRHHYILTFPLHPNYISRLLSNSCCYSCHPNRNASWCRCIPGHGVFSVHCIQSSGWSGKSWYLWKSLEGRASWWAGWLSSTASIDSSPQLSPSQIHDPKLSFSKVDNCLGVWPPILQIYIIKHQLQSRSIFLSISAQSISEWT